jgi:hypothetical protein
VASLLAYVSVERHDVGGMKRVVSGPQLNPAIILGSVTVDVVVVVVAMLLAKDRSGEMLAKIRQESGWGSRRDKAVKREGEAEEKLACHCLGRRPLYTVSQV